MVFSSQNPLIFNQFILFLNLIIDHECVSVMINYFLCDIDVLDPIFSFSPLAIHTRNLLADPRCTLVVQVSTLFYFLGQCIYSSCSPVLDLVNS